MRVILVLTLLSTALLSGCNETHPCAAMKSHAEACGAAPTRYIRAEDTSCQELRDELNSQSAFSNFSSCMTDVSCGNYDQEAQTCRAQSFPTSLEDRCLDFKLFAAGCGLELDGIDASCTNLNVGLTEEVFGSWVDCVMVGGCPARDDTRFDKCRETFVPAEGEDLVRACSLIVEWSQSCSEQLAGSLPIEASDVGTCILQANSFSPSSMLEYGLCLQDVSCDDFRGRLECLDDLSFRQRSSIEDECDELVDYAETCDVDVGFNSDDTCERGLSVFTTESAIAYIECISADPRCEEVNFGDCGSLLVIASQE